MPLNSRDIVELERKLHGQVHPELLKCMIRLNEDMHATRQMVMQLAGLFDQLVNNQIAIANATKQLQQFAPLMQRMKAMGMEVGSDPTITGEINER